MKKNSKSSRLYYNYNIILISIVVIFIFFNKQVNCQNSCTAYNDLISNLNKYDPKFSSNAYTTADTPIKSDSNTNNLLDFDVYDNDTQSFNVNLFKITSNDTNFNVTSNSTTNLFTLRQISQVLDFNVNPSHRYVVELTACEIDAFVPQRCSKALVFVPLINRNVNPPAYISPVIINAAITLQPGSILGVLNAYDIDGDKITYSMSTSTIQTIKDTIDVRSDGSLVLKKKFLDTTNFPASFTFTVNLQDDGSCCNTNVRLSSTMDIKVVIIEVNMFSPTFVNNRQNLNYCEQTYKADENSLFQIEIQAQDNDTRGENGQFAIFAPDSDGQTPQNSFAIDNSFAQTGLLRRAVVSNLEAFDYEKPKYGSNTIYIMFFAEDNGRTPRRGYCYMSIEIQDVNDNIPVFSQSSYTIYVNDGYKIRSWSYRFVATDADSGDNGKVDIFMHPRSDQLSKELFSLTNDGLLTIKDTKRFDELPNTTFTFDIYATDRSIYRNSSRITPVTVVKSKLQMLPPYFVDFPEPPQIDEVSEMTPRYTTLRNFTLYMQANTTNQFLRCYLHPKPSPEWFSFRYPIPNQKLEKNENCVLRVEDQLNYEVVQQMVLYLVAEIGDRQYPQVARELKVLTINFKDENINAPKFFSSFIEGSVVEGDDDVGKNIVIVRAYDLDRTPPFNTVEYEFYGGTNSDEYFEIDRKTGVIKLVKAIRHIKNINLEVVAKDGAPAYGDTKAHESTIYVNMKIININNNAPAFTSQSYSFDVNEDLGPGYVVGIVDVTDEDLESYFNYSISDSTFGLRPVYIDAKSKSNDLYRGSAELYLNTYLNASAFSLYDLTISVSDGQFSSTANVKINVKKVNRNPPRFTDSNDVIVNRYEINIDEKQVPANSLVVTLRAKDLDGDTNFVYNIYSTPYIDSSWFQLNSRTGELRILRGLDRDEPYGTPVQYLPISVSDLGGGPGSLITFSTVKITLKDINDHAPQLVYKVQNPLVINEEDPNGFVEFYLIDVDDVNNGPPFTFTLLDNTDKFRVNETSCSECVNTNKRLYRISVLSRLQRDPKFYNIRFRAADKGGLSTTGVLRIIVGDINNNPQYSASKNVEILTLEDKIQLNSPLSWLYVYDKDDWSRSNKVSRCQANPFFNVGKGLEVTGPSTLNNFPTENIPSLECTVIDTGFADAQAKVDFNRNNVDYAELNDVPVLRVLGTTVDDFMYKNTTQDDNNVDRLKRLLTSTLKLTGEKDQLKVITVRNYNSKLPKQIANAIPLFDANSFGVDIFFIARKDDRYLSSNRVNYLVRSNIAQYSQFNIAFLDDICSTQPSDFCPTNSFCKQTYLLANKRLVADGNATALVGLDSLADAQCYCNLEPELKTCLNNGRLVSSGNDYYCECPENLHGPRCELLELSFYPSSNSHTYALFNNFKLCDPTRIELEFTTPRQRGLLLFNGAIDREARYFISAQIFNSTIIVNVGSVNVAIFSNIDVADKQWHKLDISISKNTLQVNLDKCQSITQTLVNMDELYADLKDKDVLKMSIGGVPPEISKNDYYHSALRVYEYEGCIRNVKINGQLRDLKLNIKNNYNLAAENCDCKYQTKQPIGCLNSAKIVPAGAAFPWWIILIVVAALILLATILGLAVCTIRRKDTQRKNLQMFPDDDIRETIINYADGAGEENTDNYNIDGMKIPITGPRIPIQPQPTIQTGLVPDVPTNDQYLAFDDEGAGSVAGSLSSIETDFDRNADFDYLNQLGPKFSALNNLYNSIDNPMVPQNNNNNYDTYRNRGAPTYDYSNSPQNYQYRN